MNESISLTRRVRSNGSPPASRTSTYLVMVLASTPASFAADHAHCVGSYASRISMISLLDFVNAPPMSSWMNHDLTGQLGRSGGHRPGDLVSADQELSCPSAGTYLSAHREDAVSALRAATATSSAKQRGRDPGAPDVQEHRPRCP